MTPNQLALGLLFVAAVATVTDLQAGRISSKSKATPTPPHQETIVASVTATTLTVDVQTVSDKGKILGKTTKAYVISQFTEVTVNGQRATIADIKPGMKVSVTLGTDATKAARVVANG